jgi:hypothetical protein
MDQPLPLKPAAMLLLTQSWDTFFQELAPPSSSAGVDFVLRDKAASSLFTYSFRGNGTGGVGPVRLRGDKHDARFDGFGSTVDRFKCKGFVGYSVSVYPNEDHSALSPFALEVLIRALGCSFAALILQLFLYFLYL